MSDVTNTTAQSPFGELVANFKPTQLALHLPRWTMGMVDRMAGSRNNFVCVVSETGQKKPGSIAQRNYALYGRVGQPSVTVADFIKSYPISDGGVTRARASLLWDLDRGYIKIVEIA